MMAKALMAFLLLFSSMFAGGAAFGVLLLGYILATATWCLLGRWLLAGLTGLRPRPGCLLSMSSIVQRLHQTRLVPNRSWGQGGIGSIFTDPYAAVVALSWR